MDIRVAKTCQSNKEQNVFGGKRKKGNLTVRSYKFLQKPGRGPKNLEFLPAPTTSKCLAECFSPCLTVCHCAGWVQVVSEGCTQLLDFALMRKNLALANEIRWPWCLSHPPSQFSYKDRTDNICSMQDLVWFGLLRLSSYTLHWFFFQDVHSDYLRCLKICIFQRSFMQICQASVIQ